MAASASTLPTAFISFRHRLRQPPLLLNHTLRTLQISATGGERPQPPPLLLHQHRPSFDAFLSFHGALRHTIVDHLYASLLRKGVKAFKDDTQMERGVEVKQAISAAIGDSSIYLLLLSPGYASSSFCMDEAVEIMKSCDGGGGRVALPVFYLVTPEDVCLPTAGCFKEQFQAHFADFTYARVQGWIDALSAIGEIAGFVHNNGRSEVLLIEQVTATVRKLAQEMRRPSDNFTRYPPSLLQLASSSTAHHDDQHTELKYFQPQISSTPGSDRIVRIPKPAYADHGVNYHGHSLQLCLVAQHYSRPGATQLEMVINDDITAIATEGRSLWKDEKIEVELLDQTKTTTATSNAVLIRFPNQDTRNRVLESSPWRISGFKFFMMKWEGQLLTSSPSIPMWVRLYNVPEEYLNPRGLSYIASALGKPMYVDRATADCYYRHRGIDSSRGGSQKIPPYAKVCVEICPKDEGTSWAERSTMMMVIAIGDEKENLEFVTAIYQLEDGQEEEEEVAAHNET